MERSWLHSPGRGLQLWDMLLICWGRLLLEGSERTGQLGPVRGWLAQPEINMLQQTREQALAKPEVSFVLFVLWKK